MSLLALTIQISGGGLFFIACHLYELTMVKILQMKCSNEMSAGKLHDVLIYHGFLCYSFAFRAAALQVSMISF